KMDIDFIRSYCLSFPGATEEIQWETHLLFKVGGKMFVLCGSDSTSNMSIKANPEKFDELIEIPGVIPAPYLARAKWVAIQHRNDLKVSEIKNLIKESYELVFSKLPKRIKNEINAAAR